MTFWRTPLESLLAHFLIALVCHKNFWLKKTKHAHPSHKIPPVNPQHILSTFFFSSQYRQRVVIYVVLLQVCAAIMVYVYPPARLVSIDFVANYFRVAAFPHFNTSESISENFVVCKGSLSKRVHFSASTCAFPQIPKWTQFAMRWPQGIGCIKSVDHKA